jgi:hypothetical protein
MSNFAVGSRYLAQVQIVLAGVDMLMLPGFRKNEVKDVLAFFKQAVT